MAKRAVSLSLLVALLSALSLAAPAAAANEVYGRSASQLGLYLGNGLLASWRVPAARQVVDGMLAADPRDPAARALEGRVLFFEGRYGEALERLDALGAAGEFRDLVAATVAATDGFQARGREGFRVSWGDPKDELLVEGALDGLERARQAVQEALGFVPERPVRVEIYPTVAAFTAVSTLTREEVSTSGTIGLCKFDRLMITSPRATAWGYRWRDTLSHEYLHLAIYRLSEGMAPIWVHEGIAKYLEGAWRGAPGELSPSSRALLARRLAEDTLITLEQMSPSVAKLPSAEDTSLAFAEVGTMMAYLVAERGPGALRGLLEGLAAGRDDRGALEQVWGDSFASFEAGWRSWAETLPFDAEASQIIALHLADEEPGADEEVAPGAVPDPKAEDYSRLGDLLRRRGRGRAAAAEYAKAYALAPGAPDIASRHALGRLAREEWDEARAVAERALELYPDVAVFWQRKGEALFGAGRPAEAAAAWTELLEINPFHLPARRGLRAAAERLGDTDGMANQEAALTLLEGSGAYGDPHGVDPHGGQVE
jgi:tetratricopeptide (TPR) repeat protein